MARRITEILNSIRANLFVIIIIVFVSIVSLSLVYGSIFNPGIIKSYLAVIIAIMALVISLLSVFKNEVFQFNLKILAGDVIFPAGSGGDVAQIPIILPISFVNIGYGDGIIDSLALKVFNKDTELENLYHTNSEIDLTKFIQGMRKLHAENILGIFSSFHLKSKEALKKSIMFIPAIDNEEYPYSNWAPGNHHFKIYVKIYGNDRLKVLSEFDWNIGQDMFDSYNTGTSIFIYRTMRFQE